MSTFTTGDSGYGKSVGKDGHKNGDNSLIGSSTQTWKKNVSDCVNKHTENFSSCLALTEESLSAHNRINYKHLKQHNRKNKSSNGLSTTVLKENNWFQNKETGHNKHKKCFHNHNVTISTPTQTDINFTSSHLPKGYPQPPPPVTSSDPKTTSTHIPQVSYSCLLPPNTAAPAPFFIPGILIVFHFNFSYVLLIFLI